MKLDCLYGEFEIPDNYKNDLIFKSLEYYGEWAQEEINVLSNFIRQKEIVIDVGAFIGTHSRAFSSMVGENGRVISFEPNQIVLPFLKKNADWSKFKNITVYPFALGKSEEKCFLILENDNMGGSTIKRNCLNKQNSISIEIKSLDKLNIKHVDFLKADVEGMELEILNGANSIINDNKPNIFVESNSLDASAGIVFWAKENNYNMYGILSNAFNAKNYKHNIINIFNNAKECGLLLINKDKMPNYSLMINNLNLPKIETVDDLSLLLLHKPQYFYEVFEKSKAAEKLDLSYCSPLIRLELEKKIQEIENIRNKFKRLKI
jgi:FkbM family methyltransferase